MAIPAILTNEAHRRSAEHDATGKAFVVTAFALGNAGHDPLSPNLFVTPDPSMVDLASVVFGPKSVSGFDFANDRCLIWDCDLGFDEAVTAYSSVGLYAQIIYSPVPDDPEVNTLFLYAVAHFAQKTKEENVAEVIQVGVQR